MTEKERKIADGARQTAKTLLYELLRLPETISITGGVQNEGANRETKKQINRIVDCIISAAIMEVADIMEKAISQAKPISNERSNK